MEEQPTSSSQPTTDIVVEEFVEAEYYLPAELAALAGCRVQMIYNYMKSSPQRIAFRRDEATHFRYMIPITAGDAWLEEYTKRKKERRAAQRHR